ncbi:cell division cycle-associated protein 7-like [Prunus yedoensis var. nudiflora]|uniref:Cell division cycle-associated protein 7-like n=1 Tax=Prunus yedoensis var. nudiflora TaxID=2094558 RepID=A0A314UF90_PRUYE|nr:cell division cycle-associated protein 7-like [Prunus yedoensis var. nudiflora]
MVVQRNRGRGGNSEVNSGEGTVENGTAGVSGYEQFRDQRIKENKERLQKLGLLDFSLKLKPKAAPPKRSQNQRDPSVQTKIHNSGSPPRRSSRLKTLTPVSYAEISKPKGKRETSGSVNICIKEGSQPEIYTEEHEKLLGDCMTSWTMGVDGYGDDRKRIYDGVKGETCHQCRQKTLGQHTHCCKCDLVQGQLCGDCIYTRYGENVIEANQNPDWVCPACRGICNCSLCRKAKGWEPTGNLYRKVSKLGYKSVAHYLIQTRRSQIKSETSGAEVAEEGSIPSAEPSSHDESLETAKSLDNSTIHQPVDVKHDDMGEGYFTAEEEMGEVHFMGIEHVDVNDVGKLDAVAAGDTVDGEAKEKPRRRTRVSRN